jgi:membrane protein
MMMPTHFFKLLRGAFSEFKKNDPLRLAAATAFFTTFALPPILIILIQLFGLIFNVENMGDRFFMRISEILGNDSTEQIRSTFLGFQSLAKNWYITIGGFIFLMFVATTLFKVIKDTLNQLWCIKLDAKKALKMKMQKRAISLAVIVFAGMLFLGGTLLEGLQAIFSNYLNEISNGIGSWVGKVLSTLLSISIVTAWFSILFKFLPDAKLSWRVAIVGGFFTGILFSFGKMIIKFMLSQGRLDTVFGTSSSIVLLLLFVFYSSFILYYGACFTKVYGDYSNEPIHPAEHSFMYELKEVQAD